MYLHVLNSYRGHFQYASSKNLIYEITRRKYNL